MDSYTYKHIDKYGSGLLNTLLSEYIHKLSNKEIRRRKKTYQKKSEFLNN